MASIILGTVGAGIGSAFGGPAGAKLGFSIGATLGGFLDTPKAQNTESGKLDDLKVTASAYGTGIPQIWGGMATGGNIIWATDLQEHKHSQRQGGKGGGGATSTSYTYSVSLAVLVCAGRPGLTVSRIQANDLVLWEAGKSGSVITPRFYDGSQSAADPLIQSIEGTAPCFAGLNYFVLQDLDLSKFGNSIPQFKIETAQAGVTVGSVLADVSLLAGLTAPDFDYSAAMRPVTGFAINNRQAARDSVKPLLSWALTDLVESGGKMLAVPRGGAPALTVNLNDLGASTGGTVDLLTEKRTQDVELPWRVDVKYFSAEAGKHYEQGSQGAIRIGAPQQQATSLDLPLSLLDADARACAEQQLQQAWVERSPVILLLPPRYLTLSPADILTLPAGAVGTAYEGACTAARRLKVQSVGLDLPGVITLTCVDDDAALPSQAQPPGSALPAATTAALGAVNTSFVAWSGTELRDSDLGVPGFYVAATGAANWPGAQIYYSSNGTDWISGGLVSGRSVFGTATTALSNAPGASGDTVGVSVNGILESASAGEVAAGINAARLGAEIVGFANAALTAAGQYTLGTLTRTRRGSLGTGHASGEPFVLLDPAALARVPVPAALIGQTVQVKCVSDYQALADVAAQNVTIAVPSPTAAQVAVQGLQNQINSLAAPLSGTAVSPPPYYQMKYLFNALGRVPVAADFASAPQVPYFASGGGGDLRFETAGLALNAYWAMKLKNTAAQAVTVTWSIPYADNFGAGNWNGAALFNLSSSGPASGTFTLAAGATGLLELFYANTNSGTYNTSNQGTFWFFMDALLKAGVQFVDAATGLPPPGTVQAADIAGWNAVEAEVVAARTRTVKAVSFTTLEGRLDAIETDVAAGTALTSAAPTAETIGGAGAAGTATTAARADHAHAMPSVFGASGTSHAAGFVPDPGATAGTGRYLREDGTWTAPPAGSTSSGGGIVAVSALPTASATTAGSLYRVTTTATANGILHGTEFDGGAYNSTYAGSNAFDANLNTCFVSSTTDSAHAYIGLGFSSPSYITQVRYVPRPGLGRRMIGAVIEGSNTSMTSGYVTIATLPSTAPPDGVYQTLTPTDTTNKYAWVRYRATYADGGYYYGDITELELTGGTGSAETIWVSVQNRDGTYAWKQIA